MQSNEPVAPTFMDTINWLMGCNGDFERPKDAHEFWWRNELIPRLNIKFVWDLRKYIARDEVAPTLMQEVETHRKELIFENQELRQDNAQLQYALEQSESKWLKVAEPVAEDRTAADFCECGHPFGSHRIDGCSIASCNCLHSYRQSAAPELKGQADGGIAVRLTLDQIVKLATPEPVPSPAQPAKIENRAWGDCTKCGSMRLLDTYGECESCGAAQPAKPYPRPDLQHEFKWREGWNGTCGHVHEWLGGLVTCQLPESDPVHCLHCEDHLYEEWLIKQWPDEEDRRHESHVHGSKMRLAWEAGRAAPPVAKAAQPEETTK